MCISTSFQVLAALESWLKCLRNSVFSVCTFAHLLCVHIIFEQNACMTSSRYSKNMLHAVKNKAQVNYWIIHNWCNSNLGLFFPLPPIYGTWQANSQSRHAVSSLVACIEFCCRTNIFWLAIGVCVNIICH